MKFSLTEISKEHRQFDFWLLFFWSFVAFGLSFLIGVNFLITAALFFLVPSIYLSYKRPELIKKTTLISFIFILSSVFIVDYLGHQDGSWRNFSVIDFYIFDSWPIDDIVWGFLYFYVIIVFYEYFFDKDRNKEKISKRIKIFEKWTITLTTLFIFLITIFPTQIRLPYFYAILALMMFIFLPFLIFKKDKKIVLNIAIASFFIFIYGLLYEYVANVMVNWTFPGNNFLGQVTILNVTFPLEELLWLMFGAPAVLAYYEFFADDEK